MRILLAVFLSFGAGAAVASEAWRWVDKDGTVHYGDKPRHSAEFLDVKPGSGNGPTPDEIARIAECDRQKEELEKLKAAKRLREMDALGNMHEYTEAERLQYLANAEKKAAEACADAAKRR